MTDNPPTDELLEDLASDGDAADGDPQGQHGAGAAGAPEDSPPHGQLEPRMPQQAPQPPPKRRGVFLDPEDLRDHVGDLLRAMLGGYEVDAAGNYTFTHESARIFVTFGASPVGPTVGVFSITNLDVDFTEELGHFLLTTNHRMGFGSFSYDPENRAVWLRNTLLGTTLDGPELQATLMAVATAAANADDAIRDQFGGRVFHDAPADVQKRTRPPESDGDGSGATSNASGYL